MKVHATLGNNVPMCNGRSTQNARCTMDTTLVTCKKCLAYVFPDKMTPPTVRTLLDSSMMHAPTDNGERTVDQILSNWSKLDGRRGR